jgi:hypothetical protein
MSEATDKDLHDRLLAMCDASSFKDRAAIRWALDRIDALQAFKQWVHDYLDNLGVPKEFPEGEHTKCGCRIGDRMDWLRDRLKAAGVRCRNAPSMVDAMVDALRILRDRLDASERESEELRQRIELAGGYHERTEREIEINQALDQIPTNERDPSDVAIGELLTLVDAGRNRLHELQEKLDASERAAAALREALECSRTADHRYGTDAYDDDECWGDDRCPGCKSERLRREALSPDAGKDLGPDLRGVQR